LTAADVAVEPFLVNLTMSTESIRPTRRSAAASSIVEARVRLLPASRPRMAASLIAGSE
jgi:hypothetical protein